MRIAVYGAGAIGCHIGALLADRTDHEVTLIARGPHLEAMRARGLRYISDDGAFTVGVRAESDPARVGPQDYVIVTLKAHQASGVVGAMRPLLGADTAVVTAMNGVPWWYFHGLGDGPDGGPIETVDPGGAQWHGIGPERAIGCVVYPAAEIVEPGVCRHVAGDSYTLGEPDGRRSGRAQRLAEALIAAGLRVPVRPRIRDEIWIKLWGNLAFNPVSALTGATLGEIGSDDGVLGVVGAMMTEGQAVGEALGVRFRIPLSRRIAGAVAVGAHRTSMLQDLDRGRPMEIDALVGAVSELGRRVGVATPMIDMVLALVRLQARNAGLYPA